MLQPEPVVVCHLGRVAYQPTWTLQDSIKDRLIQAKKHGEHLPHVVLLLEHPPVFTMGKSGDDRHLLALDGTEIVYIDRGGDVTYHGPGQLVVYFLLDLDRFYRDLHRFMRNLEEIIVRTLLDYGLVGFRVPGRTGVWVGSQGHERKICAFGIHASRWVTTHGLALNVNPDLDYFKRINPCGITDRGVTSIVKELGESSNLDGVSDLVVQHFNDIFGASSQVVYAGEAYAYLERLTDQQNLEENLTHHIKRDIHE